jgi:hypothetical protein
LQRAIAAGLGRARQRLNSFVPQGKEIQIMNEIKQSHTGLKWFIGVTCFAIFGVVATFQQGQGLTVFSALTTIYGMVMGLIFGFFSMTILGIFLGWINPILKKTQKKGFAMRAVYGGMLFMVPFAVMALIAIFFLHWKSVGLFVSAAISSVAVATGAEISKLYEKPKLLNNIVPSMLATGFSMLWMYTIIQIQTIPSMLMSIYSTATQLLNLGK